MQIIFSVRAKFSILCFQRSFFNFLLRHHLPKKSVLQTIKLLKKKMPQKCNSKVQKTKKRKIQWPQLFSRSGNVWKFCPFFLVLFSKVFALSLTLFVWNALFFFVFLPLLVFLVKVTNITTFYTKLKVLFFLGSFWVKKRSEPPQKLTSFGKCLLLVERAECVPRAASR